MSKPRSRLWIVGIAVALACAAPARAVDVLAAGDVAGCDTSGDSQTAALLDGLPGAILALGDLAYPNGTLSEFQGCYDPTWGRHKARTKPAPGNHEYGTGGAAGYFDYFGAAAGNRVQGWYSFELGAWHVVSLNSNCTEIGGCARGTPQAVWLESDLAAHPSVCTLAYWHHPRFSSGTHGSDLALRDLWDILHEHDTDVVLVGHDHDYERFAPQDADGRADPRGPREFVVGTGGRSLRTFGTIAANSVVRSSSSFGVLKLELLDDSYRWQFVPVAGGSPGDAGLASCVGVPAAHCGLGPELLLVLPALFAASASRRAGSRPR